jgi:hypothetical protein
VARVPISPRVLAILLFAITPGASLAICRPASAGPCRLELHGDGAPRLAGACLDESWKALLGFELPERFADADANGWHEVVLQLDLDPARGCSCVVFRIAYEGTPSGHTVNIGDSATNDGYGGDAWSTRFDAELLVSQSDLEAFGAERRQSPAETRIFGLRGLPLADRVLELEVCDQSLRYSVGELNGFFNTYASQELLALRPSTKAKKAGADSRIYAAFNRVIHRRAGRPAHDRFGSGVRWVEIAVTP